MTKPRESAEQPHYTSVSSVLTFVQHCSDTSDTSGSYNKPCRGPHILHTRPTLMALFHALLDRSGLVLFSSRLVARAAAFGTIPDRRRGQSQLPSVRPGRAVLDTVDRSDHSALTITRCRFTANT